MVRIPVLSDDQLLPPCGVWSPGEQADLKKQVREWIDHRQSYKHAIQFKCMLLQNNQAGMKSIYKCSN
jgi:hypothetical protein